MELKRILQWLMLALLPLFLLTGCGDLEPEMQDTRTVILKMNLHEKSSLRTSRFLEADDIAAYQTHFILALECPHLGDLPETCATEPEDITSSYKDFYYSSITYNWMDLQSGELEGEVELEIPIDTDMKIFAFLFSGNYDELWKLTMFDREENLGYFGGSGIFTIYKDTDRLSLGIKLIQATTNTDIDTSAPTVTFSPPNGATGVPISSNITITFDEAVRKTNDMPLTNSNIDSLIMLYDASGADIAFDATIDLSKRVITINPQDNLPTLRSVYVYIGATVEDSADNAIAATSATFITMQ